MPMRLVPLPPGSAPRHHSRRGRAPPEPIVLHPKRVPQRSRTGRPSTRTMAYVLKVHAAKSGRWRIDRASSIAGFYSNQVANVVEQSLKRSFGPAAAGAQSQEEAKQAVFQQITVEGMRDYIISILIRLSPVVLFGLWGGAVLGRAELASVSLAAGFASFLLCWPLILDWDLLVQDHYQVYKNYFLAFYAIYILSFFVLARMSAIIAIWLKQELWRARFGKVSGDPQVSRVSVLELIVTMFLGITVNAATYAAAAALPSVGN